jgi:hypothetical protein
VQGFLGTQASFGIDLHLSIKFVHSIGLNRPDRLFAPANKRPCLSFEKLDELAKLPNIKV